MGMVRLGASSGYAVKKAADASTRFFWPASLAQVYPELAELEAAGLLSRCEDPHGARARSAYSLTPQGEAALREWLRSYRPAHAPVQLRDDGLLRLFFADALSPDERRALVARLRERAAAAEAHLRNEIVPAAEQLARAAGGPRGPEIVARLGADTYGFIERWLSGVDFR
jgi:DNA-binding PadR family transcriptional regulator